MDNDLGTILQFADKPEYTAGDETRNRNEAFQDVRQSIDYSTKVQNLEKQLGDVLKKVNDVPQHLSKISKLESEVEKYKKEIELLRNDQSGLIMKDLKRDYSEEINGIKNHPILSKYLSGDTDETNVTNILGQESEKNGRIMLPEEIIKIRNFDKVATRVMELEKELARYKEQSDIFDTSIPARSASLIKKSGVNFANVRGDRDARMKELEKIDFYSD